MASESRRIQFLIERGGIERAVKTCDRNMRLYRRAVLSHKSRMDRRELIHAYLELKQFVRNHQHLRGP